MDPTIRLTSRETDVLELLAAGHTYAQVSERLGVSVNTVASHVKNIYRKLEVHSGPAAVWRAVELQLLGNGKTVIQPGRQGIFHDEFGNFIETPINNIGGVPNTP